MDAPAARAVARTAAFAALAAASGGCAGAPKPQRHEIRIDAFVFQPATMPVHPGDTVVFVNGDAMPHTATAANRSWDTGEIPAHATRTVVVGDAGIGAYACAFHPTMKGALTKAP